MAYKLCPLGWESWQGWQGGQGRYMAGVADRADRATRLTRQTGLTGLTRLRGLTGLTNYCLYMANLKLSPHSLTDSLTDWLTDWQHQLLGDAIASKNPPIQIWPQQQLLFPDSLPPSPFLGHGHIIAVEKASDDDDEWAESEWKNTEHSLQQHWQYWRLTIWR